MATYYISPQGSDAAAGSLAAPWVTVEKFWATASAGDTLKVREGSGPYSEAQSEFDTVTYTSGSQNANPASGGGFANRSKANMTIEAYANEHPVFTKSTQSTSTKRALMRFYQQTNLIVNGIKTRYTGSWPATGSTNLPPGAGGIWLHGGQDCLVNNYIAETPYGAGVFLGWHQQQAPQPWPSDIARGTNLQIKNANISGGAAGVHVIGTIRPLIEDTYVDASHIWRDTSSDYGANGIIFSYMTVGAHLRRVKFGNCWAVSPLYGTDGGFVETYGMDPSEQHVFEYLFGYGRSDGVIETGTEASLLSIGGTNGNVLLRHALFTGDHIGSPMMLLRANNGYTIEHCAWDRTISSQLNNGGLRFSPTTGTFGGGPTGHDNVTIRDSVFRTRVAEFPIFNGNPGIPIPPGFAAHHNILYRVPGTGSNAAVAFNGGNPAYAYSAAGLASWQAAGYGVGDRWVVDPMFVDVTPADPLLRDYRPAPGSPMLGGGSNGTNIGPDVSWLYGIVPPPPPPPSGPPPRSTPFFYE